MLNKETSKRNNDWDFETSITLFIMESYHNIFNMAADKVQDREVRGCNNPFLISI